MATTTTTTSSTSTARAAAAATAFTGIFITPVPLIVVPTAAEVAVMLGRFRSHAVDIRGILPNLVMLKLLLPASSARLAIPADNIAADLIGRISTNAAKVATTRAITEREGRAE